VQVNTRALDKSQLKLNYRSSAITIGFAIAFMLVLLRPQTVDGQTFKVIHYFSFGDGAYPYAGVTVGGTGVLYGTTQGGGVNGCTIGCGVAYELKQVGSQWNLIPLYDFKGGNDGANPTSTLTVASDSTLYGVTSDLYSGVAGTVFRLTPRPTLCKTAFCYLNKQVIYSFSGGNDGALPYEQTLMIDPATGNVYGTTQLGGGYGQGVAFKLSKSGNGWVESQSYSFAGEPNDAASPLSGLISDSVGNLYGASMAGGVTGYEGCSNGCGTIYKITTSGQTWSDTILQALHPGSGQGQQPSGTLVMDSHGNIYGTSWGAIFELVYSNGSYTFQTLDNSCSQTYAGLTLDSATGDLYGVCFYGGTDNAGFVYKLTYSNSKWQLTHLHDFSSADGTSPTGPVAIDASGNLFGTAYYGGMPNQNCSNGGCGTVWEITGAAAPIKERN